MRYRAESWSSVADEFIQCPVPDCGHLGAMITKAHCRMAHNLEREEVEKLHGKPFRVIKKKGMPVE